MAKKKNVLVTILKVVLSIIGIIALLLVGAYCFLKFAMGIDIFEIKNKLDLLNQPVNEQTLITKPYDEENGFNILEGLFGENDIYTKNGDEVTFNLEAYIAADLIQDESVLEDEELASLFSIFFKNVDYTKFGLEDDYSKFLTLKQIKFSNFVKDVDSTSVDINYVLKLEMGDFKDSYSSIGGIIAFLADTFIPNDIYITSNFNIKIPVVGFENYIVTNKSFLINNLTQNQTDGILDLIGRLVKNDFKLTLPIDVNKMFCDVLFGGKGSLGLISSIKDLGTVEFCEVESGIAIVIKKV